MSNCISCNQITKKYKCPRCSEPYCSVDCFREHRKTECTPKETSVAPQDDAEQTIYPPFKTDDTVKPAKLEELRNCEPLKNLLYNPHLRSLLREIDVAPNASNAMRVAMQEPLFIEFANECLQVVEPPESE